MLVEKHKNIIFKQFCVLMWMIVLQNAGTAQTLTLDSVFRIIIKQQPELKIYDAQIKAYGTYVAGARSFDPPQVGAGLFMTPYNSKMWKPDPMTGNPGMGAFMVSAQQMFMNPRKLDANSDYMKSMVAIDKEMKNAMQNEILSMAKMSYLDWQILKRKRKVLTEIEGLLDYLVKSTEIRYAYGMDKLSGYYKAKAMLGEMQNMKLMAELEIKQERINLNTLMNRNKEISFDIDSIILIKDYENEALDTTQITSQRSDYKAYSQNINSLKSKQQYERSKRLPDFGIKYDHMLAFGTQPQQFSIMAMMSIPIVPWSSKMYKSTVEGLNFEMEIFKNRQHVIINQTVGQLQKIKEEIKNKKAQITLYENTILSSMKKNYQTSLLAYEQNTEELFMVLDAWTNLKTAQLGYLDLLKDVLMLQAEYEKQLEIK